MINSNPGAPVSSLKPPDEILIGHAQRCWDAERENAGRYEARNRLLLTLCSSLLALIFAGIAAVLRGETFGRVAPTVQEHPYLCGAFLGLPLIVAIVFLFLGLVRLVFKKSPENVLPPTVSEQSLPERTATPGDGTGAEGAVGEPRAAASNEARPRFRITQEDAWTSSHYLFLGEAAIKVAYDALDDLRVVVFASTYGAALDLKARNRTEKKRIQRAERWMVRGAIATFVMLIGYVCLVGWTILESGAEEKPHVPIAIER